jgi:superfamily I DNA/RNA helicase
MSMTLRPRDPNAEQLIAIEQEGGVLLSAGAGSGKTFVLVEHVLYRLERFMKDNKFANDADFEQKMRSFMGAMVVMTFTKKAAGEMAIRLKKRLNFAAASPDMPERWAIILRLLPAMTVGTIDSFCMKVLKEGHIKDFDIASEIVDPLSHREKITKLFNQWLERALSGELKLDSKILDLLSFSREGVIEAFGEIFGSPDLRLMWKESNHQSNKVELFQTFIRQALVELRLESLFKSFDLTPYKTAKKLPAWVNFLESFENFIQVTPVDAPGSFSKYADFFEGKTLRGPSKDSGLEEVLERFEKIKEWREFVKKYNKDLKAFEENFEIFSKWMLTLGDAFNFVEEQYKTIPGLCFADLAYYTLCGLEDAEALRSVNSSYQYFIVDEFQDTSEVQFKIIRKVIGDDFNRLYCVGDVKQAIYGFRGGELGVFRECSTLVKNPLALVANYRSSKEIIDLNNHLFEDIFARGRSFEGKDPYSVPVEFQRYPETGGHPKGVINRIDVNCRTPDGKKPGSVQIDRFEANALALHIEDVLTHGPKEAICILYRKLTPSHYLIQHLMEKKIGFTAQIKIPLSEDPILILFSTLAEGGQFDAEERVSRYARFQHTVFRSVLNYLEIIVVDNLEERIERFYLDVSTWGVADAFKKLLFDLGLANSNYANNTSLISSIAQFSLGNYEAMATVLSDQGDGSYSIEFRYGDNAELVTLMTAHASKGLEFPHVIVAGLHTNGTRRASSSLVGSFPFSVKWKVSAHDRESFNSPNMILEGLVKSNKDFAESKRLFYVASTRAINRLSFADLRMEDTPLFRSDESWIMGFRHWFASGKVPESLGEAFVSGSLSQEFDQGANAEDEAEDEEDITPRRPLFHKDAVGVEQSIGEGVLGLVPELSVTRLASISECPRKFFLRNICRFDEEEVKAWDENERVKMAREEVDEESSSMVPQIRSSAERGTEIHALISRMILSNMVIPLKAMEGENQHLLEWTRQQLLPFVGEWEMLSEVPLKFPFFGHMVSGTPDLLLLRKGQRPCLEVWDFKTGRPGGDKEIPYWFQLEAYAMAALSLGMVERDTLIKLKLVYVDYSEIRSKETNITALSADLGAQWTKLAHLHQVNLDHCSKCSFGNLCHP